MATGIQPGLRRRDDVEGLIATKRLATASDPMELASLAASLGLAISERTARRIIDGEVASPDPILERIVLQTDVSAGRSKKTKKALAKSSARNIHLEKEDRLALAESIRKTYESIADKYYLDSNVEATVKTSPGRIVISVPVIERD